MDIQQVSDSPFNITATFPFGQAMSPIAGVECVPLMSDGQGHTIHKIIVRLSRPIARLDHDSPRLHLFGVDPEGQELKLPVATLCVDYKAAPWAYRSPLLTTLSGLTLTIVVIPDAVYYRTADKAATA